MLLKCCTPSASKFGKLSSDHKTGKDQFSFHSQRRAMPKNVQTTIQVCSFHMLVRLCSKSCKLGISSTWTENFQMFKLDLEKAEEPEIKLPTSAGSAKKQESSRETFTSALLITPKPLTVWVTTNCGRFLEMEIPYLEMPPYLSPEKPVCRSRSNSWNQTWNNGLFPNWERSMSKLYIVTLFI